ncbi:hypothetical protein SO802_006070 [Lithocarpus litseifolius]|uniref:Uncharacterized protein n=1 Tax=Lithocarpus litseifolius TaxID=425828 RepID=A0AAW2DKA4_9ROSI
MNTIPFNLEMRTLAYVMIHNLYPVTHLTTLSDPRTIFLYDLFTHKEIDICGHIFYLLTKSIEKWNSRTVLPFPTLLMGLITKEKLKFSSGLTVVQRDYPIGAHTMSRSLAHIRGSKTGVSQIPRDRVEEEGGDTEEEIDRFTSAPESSAQPPSSAPARDPDRLDRLLARVDQMLAFRVCLHVHAYVRSKRAHINDFSEFGNVGSWENHGWPKWTSTAGATQVTPARFVLEHDTDLPSNNDQYLMLTKVEKRRGTM